MTFLAFRNLASIGGDLNIHSNNRLLEISGFPNVESLSGDLSILSNSQLQSFSGLTNVNHLKQLDGEEVRW